MGNPAKEKNNNNNNYWISRAKAQHNTIVFLPFLLLSYVSDFSTSANWNSADISLLP